MYNWLPLDFDHNNFPQCYGNRHRNVPVQENFSQNPEIVNDVEISIETSESTNNPSGFKVPFRWPVFTLLVSILQLAIFYLAMKGNPDGWFAETFIFDYSKRHQIWRLLTNLFIHHSKGHLWGNLIPQFMEGLTLEIVHGWKRVLGLYFCSGLIGSLTQFTLYPLASGMGASGAVYGLVAGELATVLMNWNEISNPITQAISPLLWLVLSFLVPVIMSLEIEEGEKVYVGHVTHISGAFGGFICGVFVLKKFRTARWKTIMSKVCFYMAAIWVVFGLGANFGEQIFYWKIESLLEEIQEFLMSNYTQNCTDEM